jgi:hypothetical protein
MVIDIIGNRLTRRRRERRWSITGGEVRGGEEGGDVLGGGEGQ